MKNIQHMDTNSIQKTAIITGAGRGIGKAIAISLAKVGYKTLLISRTEKKLIALAAMIKDSGANIPEPDVYPCDLSDLNALQMVLDKITKQHAHIDVLVNNAGIYKSGTLEGSIETFKGLLDVNLTAPLAILKAIVPIMKKQGEGYIFNIASRAGKIGFADSGLYASSKFGLVGLSESLYRELASHNIKVTALCPSYVNTNMAFDAGAEIKAEEMIQPDDLSRTIDYLLHLSKDTYVREVIIECRKLIS